MSFSEHVNTKPIHRHCNFCDDDFTSFDRKDFMGSPICHYCEWEIEQYFKRLCVSKKSMRENKATTVK